MSRTPQHTLRIPRVVRLALRAAVPLVGVGLSLALPAAASADPGGAVYLAANSLPVVIANLQAWVMGILAAIATLFLVLAGVYWATAGGDPSQVEKGARPAQRVDRLRAGRPRADLLQVVQGIVGV